MPQVLYHYTSLETLALILTNKSLCFNTLINVDDIEEAETSDMGVIWKICISVAGQMKNKNLLQCGNFIHLICMELEYSCLSTLLKSITIKLVSCILAKIQHRILT